MKRFSVVVALLAGLCAAQAEGPDDQYLRIYNLIQEADVLNSNAQSRPALEKYLEAQTALRNLQRIYPDWNANVVTFRLNYLNSKITPASALAPPPAAVPPGSSKPAAPLNANFALPPK